MKYKKAFTLIVILMFSIPISLTGQFPDNFIRIQIQIDEGGEPTDNFTDDLIEGYLLQALRRIPNVIIVEDNELYLIRILPSKTKNLYTVMYIVTDPLKINEISPFIHPDAAKIVGEWINLGSSACKIETYGFFNASRQTLEEQCKSFIISLDASHFQPLRELSERIIREH